MIKLLLSFLFLSVNAQDLCYPDCSSGTCIFDFRVRLTASQLGYFEVKGCEGVNPTLAMEIDVTHKFLQTDHFNYYHPLGFAYYPDGAHDNKEELEAGIPPPFSDSDCSSTLTCPTPMYMLNNKPLYSNSTGDNNFGLEEYEPMFLYPFDQWLQLGNFSVSLRFDQYYDRDIFYFCHIHQYMTGRIKLLHNDVPIQSESNLPEIPYMYDVPSSFDEACGSFALADFQLPNPQCPEKFICDAQDSEISHFATCVEAQNCHMFMGMTTGVSAKSEAALFLHQMIPHHENAVNMAKTLLMHGDLQCDEFNAENPDCVMYQIGLSIICNQNFQIQKMRGLLNNFGFPDTDDCVVPVSGNVGGSAKPGREVLAIDMNNALSSPKEKVSDQSKDTGIRYLKEKDNIHPEVSSAKGEIHNHINRGLAADDSEICISKTGRFTVRVNLFAGELGYYTFDECGDTINPTIGMEINATYIFDQADRTNYYHPLGFAYFPDGDHADGDELEPGIPPPGTDSKCAENLSCPAPMYIQDSKYLGLYSNNPDWLAPTSGEANFGLDDYEALFFRPLPQWSASEFSVFIRFDDDRIEQDIFYFCHIHGLMTGRIKLLKNGVPITSDNVPELTFSYDIPGPFDEKCGTFGLDAYQLPNDQCFSRYVCDVPENDSNLKQYSACIEAMNCHMLAGMTTKATSNSGVALFIHHMVPHHQNAVNMAKATLKFANLHCDDLTQETDYCLFETILREIINAQNHEIQLMYGVLEAKKFPKTDDCVVTMNPLEETPKSGGVLMNVGHAVSTIYIFSLVSILLL